MGKNTSVSLGSYFDNFISSLLLSGRYKNVSEVIRTGLRLLEEEENRLEALKKAINDGIESGIAENFDPDLHLKELKAEKEENEKISFD